MPMYMWVNVLQSVFGCFFFFLCCFLLASVYLVWFFSLSIRESIGIHIRIELLTHIDAYANMHLPFWLCLYSWLIWNFKSAHQFENCDVHFDHSIYTVHNRLFLFWVMASFCRCHVFFQSILISLRMPSIAKNWRLLDIWTNRTFGLQKGDQVANILLSTTQLTQQLFLLSFMGAWRVTIHLSICNSRSYNHGKHNLSGNSRET